MVTFDYDFHEHFKNCVDRSDRDHDWLFKVAELLGVIFVLKSLQPTGSISSRVLSKTPKNVVDIDVKVFRYILQMDLTGVPGLEYIYSERELKVFAGIMESLKQYGRLEDPRSVENTMMRWVKERNDIMGMFGDLESYKSGALDTYIQAVTEYECEIKIPWNPTGPNTCDDCMDMTEELYDPDDFPDPPHFGCQCNDPMAEPEIICEKK
jgi:hypothetical protein